MPTLEFLPLRHKADIEASRAKAYAAVDTALFDLYWQVGETLSRKIATAEWGEGVVAQLTKQIVAAYPVHGLQRANFIGCGSVIRPTPARNE